MPASQPTRSLLERTQKWPPSIFGRLLGIPVMLLWVEPRVSYLESAFSAAACEMVVVFGLFVASVLLVVSYLFDTAALPHHFLRPLQPWPKRRSPETS